MQLQQKPEKPRRNEGTKKNDFRNHYLVESQPRSLVDGSVLMFTSTSATQISDEYAVQSQAFRAARRRLRVALVLAIAVPL